MLHKDVLMQDIDVDQWRNVQALILESAKESRRIVVLHDAGRIRKVAHSDGVRVRNRPDSIDVEDPTTSAKALYEANSDLVDFVAVFERSAFDEYFATVQDSWDIDEELDGFVQRTYALLDEFPDGMVTYPRPARETLGLQWRIGASRDQVIAAANRYIPAGTTVVLGVVDGGALWASLVLTFDENHSATSVTTVDTSEVDVTGDLTTIASRAVSWVRDKHGSCSLGFFLRRTAAEAFLRSTDKAAVVREAASAGTLVLAPVPAQLASDLA